MPMASAPPARKASQKQSRCWRRSSPPPWGCAASTLSPRSTITCWRCETNGEAEQLARFTLSPCGRGWRELSEAKFEPGEGSRSTTTDPSPALRFARAPSPTRGEGKKEIGERNMKNILGTGEHRYRAVENWANLPDGWQ